MVVLGHEHTLAIYETYMGLKRGRCIGCSAIPSQNQQSLCDRHHLECVYKRTFPAGIPHAQLGNNGTDYNHAFAILELSGATQRRPLRNCAWRHSPYLALRRMIQQALCDCVRLEDEQVFHRQIHLPDILPPP